MLRLARPQAKPEASSEALCARPLESDGRTVSTPSRSGSSAVSIWAEPVCETLSLGGRRPSEADGGV